MAAGALAVAACAACAGHANEGGGATDVEALPELALEEELRIGDVEDPDVGFSRVGGVRVAPDGRILVPRIRFDAAGVPRDTIGYEYHATVPAMDLVAGIGLPVPPSHPTEPFRLSYGADSVVVERPVASNADAGVFTVLRFVPDRAERTPRDFGYRPIPLSPAVRDSLVERRVALPLRQVETMGASLDPRAVRRFVESAMAIPAFYPPVSLARLGADGSLWLRRENVPAFDAAWSRDAVEWLVIEADGRPLGRLALPRTWTLEWSDAERLLVTEPDDFGVPWLARYRIRGAR